MTISNTFFAQDLYKYARLSHYYLADMQKLKEEDPYARHLLESGEIFSVTKSEVPFCGHGVDQGLEKEVSINLSLQDVRESDVRESHISCP